MMDSMDDEMGMEVMKQILQHARQTKAKSLFDKYNPKPEEPEGEEVKVTEVSATPLTEEQIAMLMAMMKGGKAPSESAAVEAVEESPVEEVEEEEEEA
jgi:hypothetical protein